MLWFIFSVLAVAFSPIGRALGDRLAGRAPGRDDGEELRNMALRIEDRILELEDRIDAAERFLRAPHDQD